jgi:hypothetical protein
MGVEEIARQRGSGAVATDQENRLPGIVGVFLDRTHIANPTL